MASKKKLKKKIAEQQKRIEELEQLLKMTKPNIIIKPVPNTIYKKDIPWWFNKPMCQNDWVYRS